MLSSVVGPAVEEEEADYFARLRLVLKAQQSAEVVAEVHQDFQALPAVLLRLWVEVEVEAVQLRVMLFGKRFERLVLLGLIRWVVMMVQEVVA